MDFQGLTILFIVFISPCVRAEHRCACSDDLNCRRMTEAAVDYETAGERCREHGGRLMTVRSEESDKVVGFLLDNMIGHFWIGLRLPEGNCSSNSSALRGYEWSSGARSSDFTNWLREEPSCAPVCVSVSGDRRWTERSCAEKLDGFLCEEVRMDMCRGTGSSDVIFLDDDQCMFGPCEHTCTPVSVGYMCSCIKGFRPNARDPRRCEYFCSSSVCQALCDRSGSGCVCPDGFVRSGQNCEDIDECDSNHGCAHKCINTLGSFTCDCFHPFTLIHGSECFLKSGAFEDLQPGFPSVHDSSNPSVNHTVRAAQTTGEYVGIIIFILVAVFALLALVRYLRSRNTVVQQNILSDHLEFQNNATK